MEYRLARQMLTVAQIQKATKRIMRTDWKLTQYAERRMEDRGITEVDARNAIAHGIIIEYHVKDATKRWLLRAADGTCVMVDETTDEIVTVWKNKPTDPHATLNYGNYMFGVA